MLLTKHLGTHKITFKEVLNWNLWPAVFKVYGMQNVLQLYNNNINIMIMYGCMYGTAYVIGSAKGVLYLIAIAHIQKPIT